MSALPSVDEQRRNGGSPWRRLLLLYGASVIGIGASAAALLLALDPLDSGRFALLGEHGVPQFIQRLTGASLGRQRDRDTAVIGNSTVQLLDPARIGTASGRRAVLLTMPRTTPLEHLALADWFRRHHPGDTLRGMVFSIDVSWCRGDGRLEVLDPFPFWLYSESALDYVGGMMRLKSFEWAARKVKLLLGEAEAARADGYADFEIGRVWNAAHAHELQDFEEAAPFLEGGAQTDFAAIPRLRRLLALLPSAARVVLIVPPRHRNALPEAGSPAAVAQQACIAAYDRLAAERPHTRLLNFLGRPDMIADENFWDLVHYRGTLARIMEQEIAAALAQE